MVASERRECRRPLLFGLFQLLDVMTEFECRAQLQSHVLHNDITAQQHQSFAIDLLKTEEHAVSRWACYKHLKWTLKGKWEFIQLNECCSWMSENQRCLLVCWPLNRTKRTVRVNEVLTCFLKSSTCGPRVWGSASWTNRMTSSTDQDEASFTEPSLSCFIWSGPVVELAAVKCESAGKPNPPSSDTVPSAHGFIYQYSVLRTLLLKSN